MASPARTIRSFPLSGPDETGALAWATGVQSVRESLWNILMTRPGERLMRPSFGAGLPNFIHQPNTVATRQIMADVAREQIARHEPRIDLEEVTARVDGADAAAVVLTIGFRIRATGARERFDLTLRMAP
jgi:hypothetical protein